MAYGHAERNLALIRQLEDDVRRLLEMPAGTRLAEPVEVAGNRESARKDQPEERQLTQLAASKAARTAFGTRPRSRTW